MDFQMPEVCFKTNLNPSSHFTCVQVLALLRTPCTTISSLLQLRPYKSRTGQADQILYFIFASFVKSDALDLGWVSVLRYVTPSCKISLSGCLLACICSVSYCLCITLSLLICHHFFIRLFLQFVMLILNFNPVLQYFFLWYFQVNTSERISENDEGGGTGHSVWITYFLIMYFIINCLASVKGC